MRHLTLPQNVEQAHEFMRLATIEAAKFGVAPEQPVVPEITDEMVIKGAEYLHDSGVRVNDDSINATEQQQRLCVGLFKHMCEYAPQPPVEQPAVTEEDKIVQVSGFGVNNTINTQCDYMLAAVTESGKVVMSMGDGIWCDVSPEPPQQGGCE